MRENEISGMATKRDSAAHNIGETALALREKDERQECDEIADVLTCAILNRVLKRKVSNSYTNQSRGAEPTHVLPGSIVSMFIRPLENARTLTHDSRCHLSR